MAALDRYDVVAAIKALFIADTTTLYGDKKLIYSISSNADEFAAAKISIRTPYKMYLHATAREPVEVRAQNEDYAIMVQYKVEGMSEDADTAYARLDNIDTQINYLCNNQMWTGANLTSYFTNTDCTVIDIQVQAGETSIVSDQGYLQIESTGSIRVIINYKK